MTAAAIPGRVAIAQRAYRRLVRAIGGTALGVKPQELTVTVTDAKGLLAVAVTGPIALTGASALERVEQARTGIAARVTALTGATVGHVAIHVTSIRTNAGIRTDTGDRTDTGRTS